LAERQSQFASKHKHLIKARPVAVKTTLSINYKDLQSFQFFCTHEVKCVAFKTYWAM